MQLSQALLLASTLGEELGNETWDSCLLGISCHALGVRNEGNFEALARWPWILERERFKWEISDMCLRVIAGEKTITEVAEWVKSIEPPEVVPEVELPEPVFNFSPGGK